MKKVIVTGGAGFIGNYVCEELLTKGYIPVIFDHYDRGDYTLGCELFLGDVRDEVQVTEAMAHVDGFIHLAAVLGTQETIKNPRPAALSNLMGGLNILEASAQYKVPGVYIAVGNWWFNNPYSITKNMIERFAHMYNKDRGTAVNIVRAVNAYGPRQSVAAPYGTSKVRKITPSFICRALSSQSIEVYGDGSQVSDMVYVGDVAEALVTALEKANEGLVLDKAVEIGPSEHKTVGDVAKLVSKLAKDKGYDQLPITYLPMRPGENVGDKVTADNETLKLIGMNPSELMSLKDGMAQTVDYYESVKGKEWDYAKKL